MTTEEIIRASLLENNIAVPDGAPPVLASLCDALLEANGHMNLTAIKTPEGCALLHIADSLTVLPYLNAGVKLLDVGCGAGFPALPIAITRSDIRVNALDATKKKLTFATDFAENAGLHNFAAVCGRAEELSLKSEYRERYDVVVARAVAGLDVLCELCMPFVRPGGRFIAMKGRDADKEIASARHAAAETGGEIAENIALTLRGGGESYERAVIIIQKTAPTPIKYPRPYAQINKKPL